MLSTASIVTCQTLGLGPVAYQPLLVECANRGVCDRKSGTCSCATGYAGAACQRSVCPNDCNGHGICETQKQLADDYSYNAEEASVSGQFAVPDAAKDCVDCVGTPNSGATYDDAWDRRIRLNP
jgi:hypothetical protein